MAPTEDFIPSARPVIGEGEIEAAVRVLRSGMVVQGPEVAAFEQEFADARRRPALRRRQLRHLGAAADPDGAGLRPGRRGHRAVVLVRRHRQRRPAGRRRAGLRRHRAGQLLPRPGRGRRGDRPAHRGDHAGAPLRPPGRDGPDHGASPSGTASRSSRTPPRRTAPRCTARPVGAFGIAGCFSFYPTKNMHSLEGGMITTADAGARPHPAAAAQPGHGAAVRQRDRRRQHAADRRGRRDRPGAARASSPAGPSSAGPTRSSSTPRITGVVTPPVADGARHVYHQYTVRVPRRPGRRPGSG